MISHVSIGNNKVTVNADPVYDRTLEKACKIAGSSKSVQVTVGATTYYHVEARRTSSDQVHGFFGSLTDDPQAAKVHIEGIQRPNYKSARG